MGWERIADVNLNRLGESLKFLEDVARFSIENKPLLTQVRKIRHEYLEIKKALPMMQILAFRKSNVDLGRSAKFDIRAKKPSRDIIVANITRAKESSRILEENFKSVDVMMSSKMKKIRFSIYDLEQSIIGSVEKIFNPRLYAIIDEKYLKMYKIKDMIRILENNGVTMIQLRIKTLADRKFINAATMIKNTLRKKGTRFIINNRIDIVLACRAHGVHLGQEDMPVKRARGILGGNYIIGISARTIKEAKKAERDGADYIGVGSVFKTKTKSDARICGLSVLKAICEKTEIPVVGIGGITDKNYRQVLSAGAAGIAVSSYLFEGNLRNNIRALTVKRLQV